jgi:hypothetical protein
MPVAAYQKPIVATSLEPIARTRSKSFVAPQKSARHTLETGLFTADIFTISFNYLQQVAQMKVLKISYSDRRAIYKVILSSSFRQNVRDCWLQHEPQGWVTVLGPGLADDLKRAITTAISFHEFSAI